jgi:hypothetical protein
MQEYQQTATGRRQRLTDILSFPLRRFATGTLMDSEFYTHRHASVMMLTCCMLFRVGTQHPLT